MGPQKKRRSLSDKDARFFETLLRVCVQIVWLALGRKSFNQIGTFYISNNDNFYQNFSKLNKLYVDSVSFLSIFDCETKVNYHIFCCSIKHEVI